MSQFLRYATVNGRKLRVTLSTEGPGYKRLVDAIDDTFEKEAGDIVASRVEAGTAFSATDLEKADEIKIRNMSHDNKRDQNAHYSTEAWGPNGKVNDVHVPVDASKQTMAK